MVSAVNEILDITLAAFKNNDLSTAATVEPLEQVVDELRDILKRQHVSRLRAGDCTIELGFVFGDIATNLERISDHCSNIAGCVLEMAHDNLELHEYLSQLKRGGNKEFFNLYENFKDKYAISKF